MDYSWTTRGLLAGYSRTTRGLLTPPVCDLVEELALGPVARRVVDLHRHRVPGVGLESDDQPALALALQDLLDGLDLLLLVAAPVVHLATTHNTLV